MTVQPNVHWTGASLNFIDKIIALFDSKTWIDANKDSFTSSDEPLQELHARPLFSSMTSWSRDLLDFQIPENGITLHGERALSPHAARSISIGAPLRASLAFLLSSLPVAPIIHESTIVDNSNNNSYFSHYPFLIYAKLYQDGALEGLFMQNLAGRWQFTSSGIAVWQKNKSHINLQIHGPLGSCATELSYTSDNHLLGVRALYPLVSTNNTQLSMGGEVYYTAKERSGGISLGARCAYRDDHGRPTHLTATFNPLGHTSFAFASRYHPLLAVSTRFDFNIHSYESDLVAGVSYTTPDNQQLVQLRLGFEQGAAILYQRVIGEFMFGLGLEARSNASTSFGVDFRI